MHSFPFWTRVACVLAERSRSKLLDTLAHDCCCRCPVSPLPRTTAQARPSPRACARSLASDCWYPH
eukprot:4744647-Pleurochrysis_carterae.AAC.3